MDDSYLDVSRNEAIMEGNRFLIEGLRERVSTGLRERVSTGLRVSTSLRERVSIMFRESTGLKRGWMERVSTGLRVSLIAGLKAFPHQAKAKIFFNVCRLYFWSLPIVLWSFSLSRSLLLGVNKSLGRGRVWGSGWVQGSCHLYHITEILLLVRN